MFPWTQDEDSLRNIKARWREVARSHLAPTLKKHNTHLQKDSFGRLGVLRSILRLFFLLALLASLSPATMSQDPSAPSAAVPVPKTTAPAPASAAGSAPVLESLNLYSMGGAQRSALFRSLEPEDLRTLYAALHDKSVKDINNGEFVPQKMVLVVRTDIPMSAVRFHTH